jgi:hypothetical protein
LERWSAELDGLEEDLAKLHASEVEPAILLTGDANLQPSTLGAGPDLAQKDIRWISFLSAWTLALRNPSLAGQVPLSVYLTARDRSVMVRPGDTHHGSGNSRAIDLIAASESVVPEVQIHNGVHCSQHGPCVWSKCVDYTLGDHFLVSLVLHSCLIHCCHGASNPLPRRWLDQNLWSEGLNAASDAMRTLSEAVAIVTSTVHQLRPICNVNVGQWKGTRLH